MHARALIDTGAYFSCMNADFAKRLRVPVFPSSARTLYGANSTPLSVTGAATVNVSIGGYVCSVEFVVTDGLHHNVIFSLNMLRGKTVIHVCLT